MSKTPIKQIDIAHQKPFIKLVTRILADKKADPETDTSALEREIDRLVYQLYGLTPEEIAIVEGREAGANWTAVVAKPIKAAGWRTLHALLDEGSQHGVMTLRPESKHDEAGGNDKERE